MHEFYKSLPDFGDRLKVAITGIDRGGLKMVSVRQRYEGVFEWLEQPHVMCIRFEDLINKRNATLNAMLDEVEAEGLDVHQHEGVQGPVQAQRNQERVDQRDDDRES